MHCAGSSHVNLDALYSQERMRGCCCKACISAPRLLRPAMTDGSYGRVTEYFDAEQLAKLREVRAVWHGRIRIRMCHAAQSVACRPVDGMLISYGAVYDWKTRMCHAAQSVACRPVDGLLIIRRGS
jgi:hypothetical protein